MLVFLGVRGRLQLTHTTVFPGTLRDPLGVVLHPFRHQHRYHDLTVVVGDGAGDDVIGGQQQQQFTVVRSGVMVVFVTGTDFSKHHYIHHHRRRQA